MLKIDSQINRNFILFPINFENINMLRPSTDNESSRILKNLPEFSRIILNSQASPRKIKILRDARDSFNIFVYVLTCEKYNTGIIFPPFGLAIFKIESKY